MLLLDNIAERFDTTPEQVQQESLRLFLERRKRFVESELLTLALRYGVKTVEQLDSAIEGGRFHEAEAFEDYFRFDYLESELDSVHELLATVMALYNHKAPSANRQTARIQADKSGQRALIE